MKNLIERYVYDVSRRLPEKDKYEVSDELRANIYDMLPPDAADDDITSVLTELGSPASLAEKYRQNPRYLISPAYYDEYVRALKWVLPLVGAIVMIIGMILGAVQAMGGEPVSAADIISSVLSKGISMGLNAALQALFWITIGFVIAERTGAYPASTGEWSVNDLPEILPDDKRRIPLSDSIVELVLTVIFAALAVLLCLGKLPIAFIIQDGETQIRSLFSPGFLSACAPAIVAMALLDIGELVVKIKQRRWTPAVCAAAIISAVVNMAVMLYLVNRPNIFSAEFVEFIASLDLAGFDLLSIMQTQAASPSIIVSVVIIAIFLLECGTALYKTFSKR